MGVSIPRDAAPVPDTSSSGYEDGLLGTLDTENSPLASPRDEPSVNVNGWDVASKSSLERISSSGEQSRFIHTTDSDSDSQPSQLSNANEENATTVVTALQRQLVTVQRQMHNLQTQVAGLTYAQQEPPPLYLPTVS